MDGQAAVQLPGRHEARPVEEQVTPPRGRALPSQAGAPHAPGEQGMVRSAHPAKYLELMTDPRGFAVCVSAGF